MLPSARRSLVLLLLVVPTFLAACSRAASPTASPTARSAQVIQQGRLSRKQVALTFDAGYDSTYTDQILDLLKKDGIKATFAVTGILAERNPELVRRMVNEGHALMNHSYHHWHFVHTMVFPGAYGLTRAQRWDELDKTDALVQKVAGVSTKPYFRPPYGDYNDSVNADVAADGYHYNVLWSVDSRGWQFLPPDQIISNVLAQTQPGAIILFHLGVVQDWVALPAIIDGLRAKGYGFVTVPDMVQASGALPATQSS